MFTKLKKNRKSNQPPRASFIQKVKTNSIQLSIGSKLVFVGGSWKFVGRKVSIQELKVEPKVYPLNNMANYD